MKLTAVWNVGSSRFMLIPQFIRLNPVGLSSATRQCSVIADSSVSALKVRRFNDLNRNFSSQLNTFSVIKHFLVNLFWLFDFSRNVGVLGQLFFWSIGNVHRAKGDRTGDCWVFLKLRFLATVQLSRHAVCSWFRLIHTKVVESWLNKIATYKLSLFGFSYLTRNRAYIIQRTYSIFCVLPAAERKELRKICLLNYQK